MRPERSFILLFAALLTLLVAASGTYWLYRSQQDSARWITHTLRVENRLSTLLSQVQAAESSQRGFLLTREPEFLVPYNEVKDQWVASIATLRNEVRDNPPQAQAVDILSRMITRRMDQMQVGIDRQRMGRRVDNILIARGYKMMSEIRGHVAAMKAREEHLLAQRSRHGAQLSALVSGGMALSAALIILMGFMALRTARRRTLEAVEAGRALRAANEQLIVEGKEREVAQAQLRQVQKMESIGQLTGGIAHDFNNMLAIVIGSLDIARRRLGEDGDPRVIKGIDNAAEGAQRAAQLTARLLAFSRQQPLEPHPTDLNKLVGGMSELLRRTIGEDMRVETVLAGGLWRAAIDPSQLENAILNLCVNARDAMPGGGRVTIETANAHLDDAYCAAHDEVSPGQYVMVSVTDTGTGMPPEVVERAFDPFFTTKGVGKGTGLGLSMVHGYVQQCGGSLTIASEPGQGTNISLWLPIAAMDAVSPNENGARAGEELAIGPLVILVVDDDELVLTNTAGMLEELGHTVFRASGGAEALSIIDGGGGIDLVVTDHAMPVMTGAQLADHIGQINPALPVIIATGFAELPPHASSRPRIDKPFKQAELARIVAIATHQVPLWIVSSTETH